MPKAAMGLPRQRKYREIRPPVISTKEEERKLVDNLNGLDLDIGRGNMGPVRTESPGKENKPVRGLLDRGDLIDSLDLNIGYESIQKLKDNWCAFPSKKQKPV